MIATTNPIHIGAIVRYHGSITHEHSTTFYISEIGPDRLTIVDRDYPQVTTLRQVGPWSVTPTGETVDLCACGHEVGLILSYGLVHEPTVCGACGWACHNHVSNDPMDVHVDRDAFWAAYTALQRAGVTLAEVRADTANRVAVAVLDRRTAHGLDHVLLLAQSRDDRLPLVVELKRDTPKLFTSVTRGALDAAVEAAARSMGGR